MFGWKMHDRRESVAIKLELDRAKALKHHADIKTLVCYEPVVEDGDTLHVDYEFSVEYFNGVVAKLEAVSRIVDDRDAVKSVSVEELEHGRSIIMEVAGKLGVLIEKLR